MRKKLLALLLAAALALSLLAGCGGGESVASALLKLLDGRYPNISIEIDPELEADLRQAIRKAEAENAGDDAAVIRAALEKLVGFTVTFRKLGEGQQGDTTFDLVFYSGTDPDKAAQAAYSQWHPILSNVPDDGQYDTSLAMVETNSGVWMLVKATVEKAGTVDKPDKDDDPEPEPEPDPNIIKGEGFTYDTKENKATINGETGLQNLFTPQTDEAKEITDARNSGFDKITIELEADKTYTVNTTNGPLADTFKGELLCNNATVTLTGGTQGLFNTNNGTVQDVDIQLDGTISGSGTIGAVAGENHGTIENCRVTGGTIESSSIGDGVLGGIAGNNFSTIKGCSSAVTVNLKTSGSAGGVVGTNSSGSVTACYSTGEVSGGDVTGGVVGYNEGATITACYSTGNVTGGDVTGGVVGYNEGATITACYSTGDVTGGDVTGGVVGYNEGATITACYSTGDVTGVDAGGVVGYNENGSNVTACYWSGQVSSGHGIGIDETGESTNDNANPVTGSWTDIAEAMNDAIPDDCPYQWDLSGLHLVPKS